jgi:ferredoxin
MPKVKFDVNGQITEVETQAGETLLQVGLDNGILIEHACGGNGFCTTCLCKVKAGGENLGERNDKEENMGITEDAERLGCQATVQGDVDVEIIET